MNMPRLHHRLAAVVIALLTTAHWSRGAEETRPAADWPQFRGPNGMATSSAVPPLEWAADKNIAWKTELPGPGTSSPIVIAGKIYVTCYTGRPDRAAEDDPLKLHLLALGMDGQLRWTREIKARLPEQESIREEHGYASATPAADSNRVYTFFGKSGVVAFDHNGNQLWQSLVGDGLNGWGSAASPVLHKNLVIINASVESESLVAFDKSTGNEVWRAGGIVESWNTPILVTTPEGATELVVAVARKILGFDPASGKQLWSCDTDINWYMAPSMVAHEGVVYSVGGRTGGSLAVKTGGRGDVTATRRVWTARKGSNVTSPIYYKGHLYWMHENLGIAYCADAATGQIQYESRVPRCTQVYASPILAGGRIYYPARDGKTFVLPATPKFEVLAVNTLGERGMFNSSPAVAGNRIYLRTDRFLYCIGE
jgi:hypothetical protein